VTKRKFILIGVLSLLAALALAGGVSAQEGSDTGVTDDDVNEVASDLYCPICENTPLDVCPTKACSDWRAEIRSLLESGRNEAQVKDYFVERYGVRVLGEPPRTGFTSIVWILPFVGLAIGVVAFGRSLIQMRRAASAPATSRASRQPARATPRETPLDPDAAYVARLEQELKDFSL
jgi:cytochrome c-type biogenesis protein CcmH